MENNGEMDRVLWSFDFFCNASESSGFKSADWCDIGVAYENWELLRKWFLSLIEIAQICIPGSYV